MPEQSEEDSYEAQRAEEWAARYPSPLPSPGDRIFVKDAAAERKFLYEKLSPPHIDGYKMAADLLLLQVKKARNERKRAEESQADDIGPMDFAHWLVYPIYFSFRQSIELSLKSLLEAQKAAQWLPAEAEKLINTSHDLRDLWKHLKPWVMSKLRGLEEATDSFEKLLEEIHAEDQGGDAARYPLRKDRNKSFGSCAPLSLEAVEDAGVKMTNYIQRIWTAIEDDRGDLEESLWARSQDSEDR